MSWFEPCAPLAIRPWSLGDLKPDSLDHSVTHDDRATASSAPAMPSVDIEELIAEARKEAARDTETMLREEHERELERLANDHAAELEAARASAIREATEVATALRAAEREVRALSGVWVDNVRDNVLAIALAATHRIVGEIAASHPEVVQHSVDVALRRLDAPAGPITARLNPRDLDSVRSLSLADGLHDLRWVADERVSPGGCVIEAGERVIDANVEHSLAALYRELSHG